jgi:hypothetical protein
LPAEQISGGRTLSYWIEPGGTVLRITGPWDTWLGSDGELPERSQRGSVVGQNLLSFIHGESVRLVYDTMQTRVLDTGKSIQFPFRCDSQWLRREMQMKISLDGDAVRYDSTIIRETRRESALRQAAPGAEILVAMCSFCKSFRFPVESREWKDIELLFSEAGLPEPFAVTHGMCEGCAARCFLDL